MSCSFSICVCKTEGISFPLSFSTSPTQFQGRILKPIHSGFVESSKSSSLKSFFPHKRGLQRRMFWSIFSSSTGLRSFDLWYSLEPLLLLKTRCSSCTWEAFETNSYKESLTLLKSLVDGYKITVQRHWTDSYMLCVFICRVNTFQVSHLIVCLCLAGFIQEKQQY